MTSVIVKTDRNGSVMHCATFESSAKEALVAFIMQAFDYNFNTCEYPDIINGMYQSNKKCWHWEYDGVIYSAHEVSKLLVMMFEHDRWQALLDNATEKEIDLSVIKKLCYPQNRKALFQVIWEDKYNIFPPHIAKIPKDNGEFREVYVNEARDRIVLTLINDCLCELFKNMIHPKCVSYQKGIGTQEVVQKVSNEIVRLSKIKNHIGYKSDFSKYFDTVNIETIDNVFDLIEKRLGFEKGTEPVINLLRRYYHQDIYFDEKGNLCEKYQALKQGCAVAAFLANVVLYELDEFMSRKYKIYYRYSDDVVCIDKDTTSVIDDMNSIISKYGVRLNPKKVEPLYADKWFKFLGFNIKGNLITLSQTRVKKFQKEAEKRTIDKVKQGKKINGKQAKKALVKYLYEGEYSWGTSCLGVINVDTDILEFTKFLNDCIRVCKVWDKEHKKKTKIGGLGSVSNLSDRTILRGKGKHVKYIREHTDKYIDDYFTVGCLSKVIKINEVVFETVVRNMKG